MYRSVKYGAAMKIELKNTACFGVAGNFTGHLEQAGEAADFVSVAAAENAPKAVFPTYIPGACGTVPSFLDVFPFDSLEIRFPEGEKKVQIEPECAVVFRAHWNGDVIESLVPLCFGASNDCSIRKEGAKKISLKKNWGASSKGFSSSLIPIDFFSAGGILDRYRIASFLVRGGTVYEYGEDSAVRNYSYIYGTLLEWLLDKLNGQRDEGPAENINGYLNECGRPEQIMISIGATRYTPFGQNNFLQNGDESVVVLYPEDVYNSEQIKTMVLENDFPQADISVLRQKVVL